MRPLSCALLCAALSPAALAQSLVDGYRAAVQTLPAGASNVLHLTNPAATVYFTGTALVLDDGHTTRNLLTFASPVFGSFTIQLDANALLFGENSVGDVWHVPLAPLATPRRLATLPFNYDAVAWQPGLAIVSAKTGGFGATDNELYAVDLRTGATDLLARIAGASGAVVVDGAGVMYATATASFPPPAGSVELLWFADFRLLSAMGPTVLDRSAARIVAGGIDAASDLAIDDDGDVLFVDWFNGTVGELNRSPWTATTTRSTLIGYTGGPSASALQFVPEAHRSGAAFEPFQPAAGTLLVAESDYLTGTSQVRGVRAARATLDTSVPNPVPAGTFDLVVRGAAPGGSALFAIGANPILVETPIHLDGFEQPLFWDPAFFRPWITVPVALDASGAARLPLTSPGFNAAVRLGVQVAFVDSTSSVVGSTPPLRVILN